VINRWGHDSYAAGDRWWRSLDDSDQRDFHRRQADIASAYGSAYQAGKPATDDAVQLITQRHYDWVVEGWQGAVRARCSSPDSARRMSTIHGSRRTMSNTAKVLSPSFVTRWGSTRSGTCNSWSCPGRNPRPPVLRQPQRRCPGHRWRHPADRADGCRPVVTAAPCRWRYRSKPRRVRPARSA